MLVSLFAQSLPVGIPLIEEGLRRGQLLGTVDSLLSFNIRSLNDIEGFQGKEPFFNFGSGLKKSKNEQFNLQLLPISTQTEYSSKIPYQTNNGLMLPLAGLQTNLSAGFYAKLGILSMDSPEHKVILILKIGGLTRTLLVLKTLSITSMSATNLQTSHLLSLGIKLISWLLFRLCQVLLNSHHSSLSKNVTLISKIG